MLLWGIKDPLGPNQHMDRRELQISQFDGPKDAPQQNSSQLIRTTNIGTDPLRASSRDNVLSFSFNDIESPRLWGRGSCPATIGFRKTLIHVHCSRKPRPCSPPIPPVQTGETGKDKHVNGT